MSSDDALIEKSEGAKRIEKLCHDIAAKLDLELELVYWSFEFVEPPESERHILIIEAKNGTTTEIRFSRAEIEECTTSSVKEKTEKKIRTELEGLLETG
jgi:hypothetical protein